MAKRKRRNGPPRPSIPAGDWSWQEKYQLTVSTLDFQRRAHAASDALMAHMIRDGSDLSFCEFPTATAKRPVMMIMGVGEEVCETLRSLMEMIQDGE